VIHQVVQVRLLMALANYLERYPIGVILPSPADISWSPDNLVQPDLFVARHEELRSGAWKTVQTLLLVVEVLSPSTARQDRFTKRRLFQEVGVPLAWFVDCDQQTVEIWTPDAVFPVIEQQRLLWHPAGAAESLEIMLDVLFKPI
jgi:Uma2 family endonuclease